MKKDIKACGLLLVMKYSCRQRAACKCAVSKDEALERAASFGMNVIVREDAQLSTTVSININDHEEINKRPRHNT